MIVGGKNVYHVESFYDELDHAEMLLWTIIGKDVYLERDPHYREEVFDHKQIVAWYN
jgi:hypothetical protein